MAAQQRSATCIIRLRPPAVCRAGGAADHREYGQHHLHRRLARHQAEDEGQQEEADAADETKPHAPKAGTQQQSSRVPPKIPSRSFHYLVCFIHVPIGQLPGIRCHQLPLKGYGYSVTPKGVKFALLQQPAFSDLSA